MFVERLTKSQLCNFFNKENFCFFLDKSISEEDYHLYVSIDGESMSLNYRLYDFEGSKIPSETKWRRFLFETFGNEYKEAYKEYLQKQMESKLNDLENKNT